MPQQQTVQPTGVHNVLIEVWFLMTHKSVSKAASSFLIHICKLASTLRNDCFLPCHISTCWLKSQCASQPCRVAYFVICACLSSASHRRLCFPDYLWTCLQWFLQHQCTYCSILNHSPARHAQTIACGGLPVPLNITQYLVMLQRCARKWLRAAKQGQYAQAPGQGKVQRAPAPAPRLSHQSSASRAAMQVQQQQLAAEEAEQRLMAFCQATEGNNGEATRQHQHKAEPTSEAASAAPVMGSYSAQQTIQQPQHSKQQVARCLY